MNNIYQALTDDHDEFRDLCNKIKNERNSHKIKSLFKKLKLELIAHAKAEEETLYKKIKKGVHELVEEGREEHHVINLLLNELSILDIDDTRWTPKFTVLCENLTHHLNEEEDKTFIRAKEFVSESDSIKLAKELKQLKDIYREQVELVMSQDVNSISQNLNHK